MMYEVIITPAAEEDYHEILRYLEDALHTHQAIAAFVERLAEVMEHLQTTPEMYEYSRETRLRAKGYRKFLVGNYVVLYLIDEEHQTVFLARIFHGSQHYAKYL